MTQQVLEGTWEEVRAHEAELTGQHVRLQIIKDEWLTPERKAPEIVFDSSAAGILTDEIRSVLDPFLAFLLADARQHAMAATKVEIRGTWDPEDDTSQILARLWLSKCSDSEMWRYYRDFCSRAEIWFKSLDSPRRSVLARKISFETRRVKNA